MQQAPHRRGRAGRQRGPVRIALDNPGGDVDARFAGKCGPARQHLVDDAAEGPDVGALVDRSTARLLGTHVAGRPCDHAFPVLERQPGQSRRIGGRVVTRKNLRQAEVQNLDGAIGGDLDIGRLQIAVNHTFLMRSFERCGDVTGDRERRRDRRACLSKPLGQRLAFDQLQHERANAVDIFEAINRADVRMIERRQNPGLALEARHLIRASRRGAGDHLDGDVAAELGVTRPVHLAHAARPDERHDLVLAQPPAGGQRFAVIVDDLCRDLAERLFEEAVRPVRMRKQRLHLGPECVVVAARGCHERRAIRRRQLERRVADVVNTAPARGVHHGCVPCNARSSQSFARRQSRFTVSAETSRTLAVSSTVSPPK